MRIFRHIIVGFALLGFVLTGCRSTNGLLPREAFLPENPGLRHRYVQLNETSVDGVGDCFYEHFRGRISLLQGIKENLGKYPDPNQYFAEVEKRLRADYDGKIEFLEKIRRDFDSRKDSLFYYDYREESGQEQGWMVVRGGRILKKYPIGSSLSESTK